MTVPRGLYVRESGPADAPALVLLHGVGSSGAAWDRHATAFADLHCLAPDLPGHGLSRGLAWSSIAETAALVSEVIAARAAGGVADVVGLSLGGAVTYRLLTEHGDRLRSAVIDGAGLLPHAATPLMIAGVSAVSPVVGAPLVARLVGRALGLTDPAERAALEADLRDVDPAAFRRAFAQAQRPVAARQVVAAATPTLLLSGEREPACLHAGNAVLAASMPCAQAWTAPGLGHGWMAVRGDLHRAAVRAWLVGEAMPAALRAEPRDEDRARRQMGLQ